MVKKDGALVVNKPHQMKMLPPLYQNVLKQYLDTRQLLSLQMLVWVLQFQKQVRLERLAALMPLPIKFESRRRHIQRLLNLGDFTVKSIWFPIILSLIKQQFSVEQPLIIAIDRTQWNHNNLFMVSCIWGKRAWPIYWVFLDKRGASNFQEQKDLLDPVFSLLKDYDLVVIGDREFHSVELANWLHQKNVGFALRQKRDTYIQQKGQDYQALENLGLTPGMKLFLTDLKVTKSKGFGGFNMVAYWKRKYRQKKGEEPWYILTNLDSLEAVIKIYRQRMGIEAMFKDCKTGGYNLESTKVSRKRLESLVLLMALAYTWSGLKGQKIKAMGQQKYICRLQEIERIQRRHSNFWVGSYGCLWLASLEFCLDWATAFMQLCPDKQRFYQRGLNAVSLIQKAI